MYIMYIYIYIYVYTPIYTHVYICTHSIASMCVFDNYMVMQPTQRICCAWLVNDVHYRKETIHNNHKQTNT